MTYNVSDDQSRPAPGSGAWVVELIKRQLAQLPVEWRVSDAELLAQLPPEFAGWQPPTRKDISSFRAAGKARRFRDATPAAALAALNAALETFDRSMKLFSALANPRWRAERIEDAFAFAIIVTDRAKDTASVIIRCKGMFRPSRSRRWQLTADAEAAFAVVNTALEAAYSVQQLWRAVANEQPCQTDLLDAARAARRDLGAAINRAALLIGDASC